MRAFSAVIFIAFVLAAPESQPSPSFFTNLRRVTPGAVGRQNYIVIDEEIWNHTRKDLADIRLYDPQGTQIPYVLNEQRGGIFSEEQPAKVLNLGAIKGHTEFDVAAGEIAEYDRIRLQLDAKDFVSTASVEGTNAIDQAGGIRLGSFTLYDFSRENLGSNSVLKLPRTSFRYLHLRLSPGVLPKQVKGATIYDLQEKQSAWTDVGVCHSSEAKEHSTIFHCNVPAKVPLERILFRVTPRQVNFRRNVSVTDEHGGQVASGEITRIKMNRAGTTVTSEELSVKVIPGQDSERLTVTIDNGDDPGLTFDSVQPQSIERRLYFEPRNETALNLYYGDQKLTAPVYDYAKFFKPDGAAVKAVLGPGTHNEAYAGRPDDRPWSERHRSLLWIAMLVAVGVLAALAVRGLKTAPA
jgi:uncharacterized protein DUF3999